ncbi:MAG: hypothetical protein F6J87_02000 [Spirulina sp. SIO3F2]|nr:hypothetical protein [Spirulina sp. SIO3F2]
MNNPIIASLQSRRTFLITTIAAVLPFTVACSSDTFRPFTEPKNWFNDVMGLGAELEQFLPAGQVKLNAEGRVLTVTLINTPSNDASPEEREAFAGEVADQVRAYLKAEQIFPNLKTIVVSFKRQEKRGAVDVMTSVGSVNYRFPIKG